MLESAIDMSYCIVHAFQTDNSSGTLVNSVITLSIEHLWSLIKNRIFALSDVTRKHIFNKLFTKGTLNINFTAYVSMSDSLLCSSQ